MCKIWFFDRKVSGEGKPGLEYYDPEALENETASTVDENLKSVVL